MEYSTEYYSNMSSSQAASVDEFWGKVVQLGALFMEHKAFLTGQTLACQPSQVQVTRLMEMGRPNEMGIGRSEAEVVRDAREILGFGITVGHPRFYSCIPSPASPLSWLGDIIATAFNPFGGSLKAGSGVCAIETALITWISERFGLPAAAAGGHFVSGASLANLTALTVARDQMIDSNVDMIGPSGTGEPVVYLSSEAHFCILKNLRILGFKDKNVRVLKTNDKFQMDVVQLKQAILDDRELGKCPILVIATCGTTNTGSIDPFNDIADIAARHGMWMHVDAAYGGSVCFSETHRDKANGIGRANSIAWDAHKWLFQTHGCGALLFRDKHLPLKSFAASGDYVRDVQCSATNENIHSMIDPYNMGIPCTRPPYHMKLWFTLQVLGMDAIDQMIDHGFKLAQYLEWAINNSEGWEVKTPGSLAILTFRYAPQRVKSPQALNHLNELISSEMIAQNIAIIWTTRVRGEVRLRMCMINPTQEISDVDAVVNALNSASSKCLKDLIKNEMAEY